MIGTSILVKLQLKEATFTSCSGLEARIRPVLGTQINADTMRRRTCTMTSSTGLRTTEDEARMKTTVITGVIIRTRSECHSSPKTLHFLHCLPLANPWKWNLWRTRSSTRFSINQPTIKARLMHCFCFCCSFLCVMFCDVSFFFPLLPLVSLP